MCDKGKFLHEYSPVVETEWVLGIEISYALK
jgi:hypothetical protein